MTSTEDRRRSKLAEPQPRGRSIVLGPRDLALFCALDRHGKLPSGYLLQFVGGDRSAVLSRLTKLYHGACPGPASRLGREAVHDVIGNPGPYVGRDPAQYNTLRALSQQTVYHLLPCAREVLSAHGLARRYAAPRTEPFLHQLFQSCLTASFELRAEAAGVRFLSAETLIGGEKCPVATRNRSNPLTFDLIKERYVPDDLLGIEFPDHGKRYFLLEVDRGTEPGQSNALRSTLERKIRANLEILEQQAFRSQFGVGNLSFLYATTGVSSAEKILRLVQNLIPLKWQHKFLCQAHVAFQTNHWVVPRALLDVFAPWSTPQGAVSINHPPAIGGTI